MTKNGNLSAYPLAALRKSKDYDGLTKREYVAIQVMQAIIIGNSADSSALGKGAALDAVACADDLLDALEKEPPK